MLSQPIAKLRRLEAFMTPKELAAALEAAFQQAREMDASLGERLAYIARVVRSLSPPFVAAPPVSAQNPWSGFRRVILDPIV